MSGNKLLLDTNIALYLMGGDQTIAAILDEKEIYVSVISEMELLAYPGISNAETLKIKAFLKDCQIIELTNDIKESTINLRKQYGLKLPDAIVAACALHYNIPLITSDKDFQRLNDILNLVLYHY